MNIDHQTPEPQAASALRSPRFLIISEPRTGSNNVSYVLAAHPDLTVGNELLHPRNGIKPDAVPGVTVAAPASSSEGYHWVVGLPPEQRALVYRALFERHNGFKIHSQHVPAEIIAEIVRDFDCKVIITSRIDLFGQAISNAVAAHRDRWHADERRAVATVGQLTLPPPTMLRWLDAVASSRLKVWAALAPWADRVFMCQYEVFFAGTKEARLGKFLHLLDFLGVPRFGQLPKEQMGRSIQKALHYLDPAKQKMTSEQSAQDTVSNYDELHQKYELWTMHSFAKILPS